MYTENLYNLTNNCHPNTLKKKTIKTFNIRCSQTETPPVSFLECLTQC